MEEHREQARQNGRKDGAKESTHLNSAVLGPAANEWKEC